MPRMPMYLQAVPRYGLGDTLTPAVVTSSPMDQAIAGAKAWMSPTAAIQEIKGAFSGAMPPPARLAGLAVVPLALLAVFMPKGRRR